MPKRFSGPLFGRNRILKKRSEEAVFFLKTLLKSDACNNLAVRGKVAFRTLPPGSPTVDWASAVTAI